MAKDTSFSEAKSKLEKKIQDKLPVSAINYTKLEGTSKTSGQSEGFRATREHDEYMLKPADMEVTTPEEIAVKQQTIINLAKHREQIEQALNATTNAEEMQQQKDEIEAISAEIDIEYKTIKIMQRKVQDKGDFLREYMAPFDRLLYDKTTSIGINTDKPIAASSNSKTKQEAPDTLYSRSKIIDGFEPLENYMFYDIKISKAIADETPAQGQLLVGLYGKGFDRELVFKNSDGTIKEISINNKNIQDGITSRDYSYLSSMLDSPDPSQELILEEGQLKELRKYAIAQFGYSRSQDIQEAKGLEKALAACMFLGDSDYHGSNLGIIDRDGEKSIIKLDHGRAYYFNNDDYRLRRDLYLRLSQYSYQNINVDVQLLKDSIDQMTQISDTEIEDIVKNKSYELKRMGFKLDDTMAYYENNEIHPLAPASADAKTEQAGRYENMEKNYIELYKKQKQALIRFSQDLDVALKIDMPEEWKRKEWIHQLEGQNPLNWAIENGKTIQGINAKIWGVLSGKKADSKIEIDKIDPVLKFKFYLANKQFDQARIEAANIKSLAKHDQTVLLSECQGSGQQDIVALIEAKIAFEQKKSELFKAAKASETKKVIKLIDEIGDVNIKQDNNLTILHIAAKTNNIDLVEELLKRNINVDAEFNKTTAIQLAINEGRIDIAKKLIAKTENINHENQDGLSALDIAVSRGQIEIVDLLTKKGATSAKYDEKGPLDLAINNALTNHSLPENVMEKIIEHRSHQISQLYKKKDPNQLTSKEINALKKYFTDPNKDLDQLTFYLVGEENATMLSKFGRMFKQKIGVYPKALVTTVPKSRNISRE